MRDEPEDWVRACGCAYLVSCPDSSCEVASRVASFAPRRLASCRIESHHVMPHRDVPHRVSSGRPLELHLHPRRTATTNRHAPKETGTKRSERWFRQPLSTQTNNFTSSLPVQANPPTDQKKGICDLSTTIQKHFHPSRQ